MNALTTALGRRFARLATDVAVRRPALWRFFRAPIRKQFDGLAPQWEERIGPQHLASYDAALAGIDAEPARALDLGTGHGNGARAIAQRFPRAEVVGADLSAGMLAEARRRTDAELSSRVRFEQVDASSLPFDDESFDLVAHLNMIPFFDELARVTAAGGYALFSFARGAQTPIYVPAERLRTELSRRGFTEFADFTAGDGVAMLARKGAGS